MHTQRTIVLIVGAVLIVALGAAGGLIWWLGWVVGTLVALLTGAALMALYVFVIRPWHTHWGATPNEIHRELPGDTIVPDANATTRAISIAAEPAAVWPWLVQIGFGRAGWYSYDWIDNDGIPSADHIVPGLQELHVGDQILMMPSMGPFVVEIDDNRALVSAADDATSSWCLALFPDGDGGTRLLSRWRTHWKVTPASALMIFLSDPGAFIMEQKMLREIRNRAEQEPLVLAAV